MGPFINHPKPRLCFVYNRPRVCCSRPRLLVVCVFRKKWTCGRRLTPPRAHPEVERRHGPDGRLQHRRGMHHVKHLEVLLVPRPQRRVQLSHELQRRRRGEHAPLRRSDAKFERRQSLQGTKFETRNQKSFQIQRFFF